MKAAFLTAAKTIELRNVPEPVLPEDGLIVEVKACGICGSDIRRWAEGPPTGTDGVIPGHEAAGIVTEVGKACRDFAVGDRLSQCYSLIMKGLHPVLLPALAAVEHPG